MNTVLQLPIKPPLIVGITGLSASGKTTLAREVRTLLKKLFPQVRVAIVGGDNFYKDLSHLQPEERKKTDFDSPDAVDHESMRRALLTARETGSTTTPVYSFLTQSVEPEKVVTVGPVDIVIVESFCLFFDEAVRNLLDIRVFLIVPENTCKERRVYRDISERGHTLQRVEEQWKEQVLPNYYEHYLGTMQYANLVLNGGGLNPDNPPHILRFILEHLQYRGNVRFTS